MQSQTLLQALTEPASLPALSLQAWDRLLPLARRAGLLGRLQAELAGRGLLEQVPAPVRLHLEAAGVIAAAHERMIRWEVDRVRRALADLAVPIVLLKGAAYVLAELPCARGRLAADVDILVPREQLQAVEAALLNAGWETASLDDYDQHYYRQWMHELPPLRHRRRGTVVDVHHAILPLTARRRPDPQRLLAAARPLGSAPLRVLAPTDMVLHSAAHAFHDGDLSHGLRDLLDLHDLLCHFGGREDGAEAFWDTLTRRARELDLERPLYYALRYTRCFLGTPMPATVHVAGPGRPLRALLDGLVGGVVLSELSTPDGRSDAGHNLARWLLYLRSHWLRMPPWLLAGHLLRKAWRRLGARRRGQTRTPGARPMLIDERR